MTSKFLPTQEFWSGKRVFLTGHTGFKGGWLALWLRRLGATVRGYSLEPATTPCFFNQVGGNRLFESISGDIREREVVKRSVHSFAPDVVLHLAAQALVIDSYKSPFETFEINALGTASLLEACRDCQSIKAIVAVSTDKCYENKEWVYSYREPDALGGSDPYSASKAASELVVASYRNSFFRDAGVSLASVRAGNVFGGGDWAENRIVPDGIRAFSQKVPLKVRHPQSIRPWQFVLEPLLGYLMVARACLEGTAFDTAWNFGPNEDTVCTVAQLADAMVRAWGDRASWVELETAEKQFKEASLLLLNSSYAKQRLGWKPVLNVDDALEMTVDWYLKSMKASENELLSFSEQQIEQFSKRAVNTL